MRGWALLQEFVKLFWPDNWEAIIGLVALVASTVSATGLWQWVYGVLAALLTLSLGRNGLTTLRELREKHLPLLVVVGRNEDATASMAEQVWGAMAPFGFNLKEYDVRYNIERENLTVRRESDLPKEPKPWGELVQRFEEVVMRLNRNPQLKGRKVLHLFFNAPAALAVGMGAVVGTKVPFGLHHYQNGAYHLVMDFGKAVPSNPLGAQQLKMQARAPFQHITAETPAILRERLFVGLHMGSAMHDPRAAVQQLANTEGAAVAYICNTYDNVLGLDANWAQVVQEIVTQLAQWGNQAPVKQIELFLNMPVPLAFALGMALGTQSAIVVHQWFPAQSTYYPVLTLNKLRRAH